MNLIARERRKLSHPGDEVDGVIRTAEAAGLRFWIDRKGRLRIDLSRKKRPLPDSLIAAMVANEEAIRKRLEPASTNAAGDSAVETLELAKDSHEHT
jgi:hypothetical protein